MEYVIKIHWRAWGLGILFVLGQEGFVTVGPFTFWVGYPEPQHGTR